MSLNPASNLGFLPFAHNLKSKISILPQMRKGQNFPTLVNTEEQRWDLYLPLQHKEVPQVLFGATVAIVHDMSLNFMFVSLE